MFSFSTVVSFAVDKSTAVELELTYVPYVNLLGSVVGASVFFSTDNIKPVGGVRPIVSLGSLGFESNVPGICTLSFSSQKNWRLRHTISNQRLTAYRLFYKNKVYRRNKPSRDLSSCNVSMTSLDFRTQGPFRANPQAGIYQDTMTITVTTQ